MRVCTRIAVLAAANPPHPREINAASTAPQRPRSRRRADRPQASRPGRCLSLEPTRSSERSSMTPEPVERRLLDRSDHAGHAPQPGSDPRGHGQASPPARPRHVPVSSALTDVSQWVLPPRNRIDHDPDLQRSRRQHGARQGGHQCDGRGESRRAAGPLARPRLRPDRPRRASTNRRAGVPLPGQRVHYFWDGLRACASNPNQPGNLPRNSESNANTRRSTVWANPPPGPPTDMSTSPPRSRRRASIGR
jgi:hypothetical protein